jgi:hypothetical protein
MVVFANLRPQYIGIEPAIKNFGEGIACHKYIPIPFHGAAGLIHFLQSSLSNLYNRAVSLEQINSKATC